MRSKFFPGQHIQTQNPLCISFCKKVEGTSSLPLFDSDADFENSSGMFTLPRTA